VTYCDCIQDDDDLDVHMQRIRTSRPTFIEVKIPKECVGVVIGRGGSSIRDIEEKTNTRIIFKDECKYFCGHKW
jgi:polyribonucleotide nucleotidyltransferase